MNNFLSFSLILICFSCSLEKRLGYSDRVIQHTYFDPQPQRNWFGINDSLESKYQYQTETVFNKAICKYYFNQQQPESSFNRNDIEDSYLLVEGILKKHYCDERYSALEFTSSTPIMITIDSTENGNEKTITMVLNWKENDKSALTIGVSVINNINIVNSTTPNLFHNNKTCQHQFAPDQIMDTVRKNKPFNINTNQSLKRHYIESLGKVGYLYRSCSFSPFNKWKQKYYMAIYYDGELISEHLNKGSRKLIGYKKNRKSTRPIYEEMYNKKKGRP